MAIKSEPRTGKIGKGAVKKMRRNESINGKYWVKIEKVQLKNTRRIDSTNRKD